MEIANECYHLSLGAHNKIVVEVIYDNLKSFENGHALQNLKCHRYMRIINHIHYLKSQNCSGTDILGDCLKNMIDYIDAPKE